MDPDITLERAGDAMLEIKQIIFKKHPEIKDITIQLEPHVPEHVTDVPSKLV